MAAFLPTSSMALTQRSSRFGRLKHRTLTWAAVAALGFGAGACSSGTTRVAGPDCDTNLFDAAIQRVVDGGVIGQGPYGEAPTPGESVVLTEEELTRIRGLNATAAIAMHFSGDSWSNAQINGLKGEFDRLGIRVVAQTDAQADPAKQFSDIETALAAQPDVLVSIPSLDPIALAPAFRKAADAGVHLVFMENPANEFQPGSDYVSVVATDNYGAGVLTAHQLARALCGAGSVGVVFHAAQAPTNVLRERGFVETLEKNYPDIDMVESKGLLGPDWKGEGSSTVNAWLTKYPDLAGVWCWFDAPCEGAIDAARSYGSTDLSVTAIDLGNNVAIDLARGSYVPALAAAQPYGQGVIEARLAGYALIGKPAPPFVEVPALAVTRENLAQSWQQVYRTDPPADLQKALGNN